MFFKQMGGGGVSSQGKLCRGRLRLVGAGDETGLVGSVLLSLRIKTSRTELVHFRSW